MRRPSLALAAGLVLLAACSSDPAATSESAEPLASAPPPPEASEPSEPAGTEPPPPEGEPFDVDPDVRIGTLDNGLTYYLRDNDRPGARVELRLVVDAGSVLEDDDQSGVAHFLEHMLFNGTERFPENELVDVLRGFGADFGADINASTSYDETVYELSVPTDDDEVVGTAFDVLVDWLSAATIDEQQVIDERGVVLDEYRGSEEAAGGRIFDAIERLFFAGTAYEGRDPIGDRAAIEAMTAEPLRRFYDQWYRPDTSAVVVVGDLDLDTMEALVRDGFATVESRTDATGRVGREIAISTEPRAEVYGEPDLAEAFVELTLPTVAEPLDDTASAGRSILDALVFDVIASRLADDVARGDTDLLGASVDSNSHVRPLDAPSVLVDAEPDDVDAALDALLVEFERVRRYGFGDAEVARAVDRARAASDAAFDARDTVQDVDYAARYVDHFLTGSAIADAETTYEFEQALLDSVSAGLLAERFAERWAASAPHVLVVGPADAELPDAAEVVDAVVAMADRDVEDRADDTGGATQLMEPPEPVGESSIEELVDEPGVFLDATMLEFPNGARLIVNPTDIVDGRVSLAGRSPGGLSLVADADVAAAQLAGQVVGASGLGDLDVVATDQLLAGTDAFVEGGLTPYEEQLYGDAASSDLETLFQLLHLTMAAPNIDDVAVDRVVTDTELLLADVANDQDLAVQVELYAQVYGDEPRLQPLPEEAALAGVDAATVERVWAERFGDAGDWVFSLAGDVDEGEVLDLARRYIGTLPGSARTEEPVDLTPDPPPGVVRSEVAAGTGDRGEVVLFTAGPARSLTLEERVHADVVTGLVSNRLTDVVREELGESYSPFSVTYPSTDLVPRIETIALATGAPDRLGEIARIVQSVIAPLRAGEVTDDELSAAVESLRSEYELFSNEQLNDVLLASVLDDRPADELVRRVFVLDEVDAASVATFTTEHLPIDRYVEVTAIPA